MNPKSKVQSSKSKTARYFQMLMLLFPVFCFASCSVPNLEKPECTQAREAVKQLYSLHFGGDMRPSEDYWKLRAPYLTQSFSLFVSKQITDKRDFFTLEEDYPKAFRVGGCEVVEPEKKAKVEVLLFWKDENRSEQKKINVNTVKENNKWLIDGVETK